MPGVVGTGAKPKRAIRVYPTYRANSTGGHRDAGAAPRRSRWHNLVNPPANGWIVRVWHELTGDSTSTLVVRQSEFDRRSEAQVALPQCRQVVVESERLWHGGFHACNHIRYALIGSVESSPAPNDWIQSQLPGTGSQPPPSHPLTRRNAPVWGRWYVR